MNILSTIAVTIFAIWGVAECIRMLVIFFCNKTSPKDSCILIVPIKGDCQQAEYIIRCAAQQAKFSRKNIFKKVVCILEKPTKQTEQICRQTAKDYSFVEVLYLSEMQNIFY